MYTLQILDAGQTFLHAIGDQPVALGAADDAQIRLRESGVEARHARFEPSDGGVRMVALAPVRINGQLVDVAQLQLGDRIEIGRAVVVVGRTVARAAGPDDVLASAVSRAGRRPQGSVSHKLVPILVAALVAVVALGYGMQGDGRDQVRGELAWIEGLRAKGRLDEARQEAGQLRREWAAADDDRLLRLDAVDAAIAKVDATRAELTAKLLDPADTRNYVEWFQELLRLERGGTPDERVAATKVRSRLRETLRERDERIREAAIARHQSGANDLAAAGGLPATSETVTPETGAPEIATTPAGQIVAPTVQTSEVERFCADGMYAQAMALVQAGFEQARDAAAVTVWRSSEQLVHERAITALGQLLAEARGAAADGRLQHAVALLQSGRHRFPASPDFRALGEQLASFEAQARAALAASAAAEAAPAPVASKAVDESTRLATLASLRSHMDAVRSAEERGAFRAASTLLREAAKAVRSRDDDFADRLVVRADEAELLAVWHETVVQALQAGKPLTTTDAAGRRIDLRSVDGHQIVGRSVDGDIRLSWHDIDAAGVQALARQIKASGRPALGAAALLYKQGESEAAEAMLLQAVRANAGLQPDITRVIARGRGENPGEHGYVLQKGKFVSARLIEVQKRVKQLGQKLDSVLRARDVGARDAFVAETLAAGGIEPDALASALRAQMQVMHRKFENASLKKQVDKLVVQRERLDDARAHAKELIYDEARYFYPYKPPAVSGDKHAEYNRVQAEVNQRVAAVRELWQGSRVKIRVPARVRADLDRLDWTLKQLSRLGAFPPGESAATVLADLAWVRALPVGETVGLQQFCVTPAERRTRAGWRKIEAYNELIGKQLTAAQRAQLRITNDYRVMFGHRPVAVVVTCCAASQGHADEMSRLGYFAHTSPTPGMRTPYDRMRKAGYMFGVSENIAATGGALSAHNAWCRSSGHHRNLLAADHREMGIGASGRYWVQNFGSGEVHLSHPEWASLQVR